MAGLAKGLPHQVERYALLRTNLLNGTFLFCFLNIMTKNMGRTSLGAAKRSKAISNPDNKFYPQLVN